jgi:hypothetical protein
MLWNDVSNFLIHQRQAFWQLLRGPATGETKAFIGGSLQLSSSCYGLRTADIWQEGCQRVGTREMGDAVLRAL